MHAASAYLLRLVTCSQEGGDEAWQAPSMSWTLRGTKEDHHPTGAPLEDAVKDEDVAFASRAPAEVIVTPKPKPASKPKAGPTRANSKPGAAKTKPLKRPAAAAAPCGSSDAAEDPDHVSLPSPDAAEDNFLPANGPKPPTASSAAAGAPPRTAVEVPQPKAKQAAAAKPKRRKAVGWLPLPEGAREKIAELNHSKCRSRGCPDCRKRVGLILNEDESAWIWERSS